MVNNKNAADLPREDWHSWDPMLLSGLLSFLFCSFYSFFRSVMHHSIHAWINVAHIEKFPLLCHKLKSISINSKPFLLAFPRSRGPIQCGEYIQFTEISLHILGESSLGSTSSVTFTHGYGYHEVFLPLCTRVVCLQFRSQSVAMVITIVVYAFVCVYCNFSFVIKLKHALHS